MLKGKKKLKLEELEEKLHEKLEEELEEDGKLSFLLP
jgi:hypothetical protein